MKFLIILFIFLPFCVHAQADKPSDLSYYLFAENIFSALPSSTKTYPLLENRESSKVMNFNVFLPGIQQGLFCRLEDKLGKQTKVAPRFRLGSVAYTEWMEGKRQWKL